MTSTAPGPRVWYQPIAAGLLMLSIGGTSAAQTQDAYFEFLMAQHLEAQGDQAGALAALERAAAADPASAEVKAEIASFQLRRNRRTDAESAGLEALKLDSDNLEAHRVLGLIYAADVDATRGSSSTMTSSAATAFLRSPEVA